MKKILVLTLLVMSVLFSYAQSLVPFPTAGLVQGEIRHGDWTDPGQFDATFTRIADTVIAGTTYSRFIAGTYPNTFYSRYDNGKVYKVGVNWDGSISGESIRYDFALSLGDTFPSPQYGDLVVDSVSTITLLTGEVRKYMRLDGWQGPHIWIDGIGDIEKGFMGYWDFEGGHVDFVCHTDATGLLWVNNDVSYDCDSLTGYTTADMIEHSEVVPGAYPNPANDALYLNGNFENPVLAELTFTDLSGKMVMHSKTHNANEPVDVSSLATGIYTCSFFDGKDRYNFLVIKN
jgi:hypothetical protein